MPSRWFVPIRGLDAAPVKPEHVHAAFSAWFDRDLAEHHATDKPYTVSPITSYDDRVGVEIAALTDGVAQRLWQAAAENAEVRLGNRRRRVGRPVRLAHQSWTHLADSPVQRLWTLHLVTPTTFRSGDRSSPLPSVATILRGLSHAWRLWSDAGEPSYDDRGAQAVWVSDLNLRSEVLELQITGRQGGRHPIVASGSLGTITLRCDDETTARQVSPLLQLAPYVGLGSMRGKGLGIVRLTRTVAFDCGDAGYGQAG